MAHSKTIGGSTANRTLNCPAWLELREHVPAQIGSSSYAAEGTMLHRMCELLSTEDDLSLDEFLGEKSRMCW